MSWTKTRQVGLTYHDPKQASEGYTLISSEKGRNASLLNMEGQIVHQWHQEDGIRYAYLLSNGHLLMQTATPPYLDEANRIGGSAGALREIDWDSNVVWEYKNPRIHHDFLRLPNGNYMTLVIEGLPEGMTEKVQGGQHYETDPEVMWGDKVLEINPKGEIVYEWRSWEHLDLKEDIICPLENRKEWTHINSLSLTPDGDILLSFRAIDVVGIIDRNTGAFKWKWGRDTLSHQHHATHLETGRILIFDNGAHRRNAPSYSRIIEVDPKSDGITWEYKGDPLVAFNSFALSSAQRLLNGNTLICEGVHGRIFEITSDGETVWEYLSPYFQKSRYGLTSSVFRAHRYTADHPALKGKELNSENYTALNALINNGLNANEGGILEDVPDFEDAKEKEAEKK